MVMNKKLDCGLRFVMEKIPYVQSAAIGIWVKAGAVDETEKNAGISHYIEHMLFKGTTTRTAKQVAEDIDKIGGQINAFTGKEATCYYVKTLGTNLEKACDVLIDMFKNSLFDEVEMEKEKNVIYEEMKMIEDSPDDDAHETLEDIVFKGTALGKSIIGTKESLKGITRDDIKAYLDAEYTRDHIVVSIVGNFDEERVMALFEGKLSSLRAAKDAKVDKPAIYVPEYKVKVKDIEQSHICLGVKGICLDDDRYYTLALLNNVMGGSMSSRLFQNIREEKGLAYSVYSMSSSYSKDGYYNIYAGVSHDKIRDAILGIGEELKSLAKDGITDEELATSKEQMKSGYIFGLENVNGRMAAIGKNTLLLGKVRTPEEVIANIDRVTMDDIRAVSALITDFSRYSAALVTGKETDLSSIMQEV